MGLVHVVKIGESKGAAVRALLLALVCLASPLSAKAQDWSCVVSDCAGTVQCAYNPQYWNATFCNCTSPVGDANGMDYRTLIGNHPECARPGSPEATAAAAAAAVTAAASSATSTSVTTSATTTAATSSSTSSTTGTSTATAPKSISHLAEFTAAMAAFNLSALRAIGQKAEESDGRQMISLHDASEVNRTGANQAATVGALFCAQGANANLEGSPDAPAYYSGCKQNFDAAMAMSSKGGLTPDGPTLNSAAGQEALEQFEKNFGVGADDYMSRMLGAEGGIDGLTSMIDGKISSAQFTAALEAAAQVDPSSLTQDSAADVDYGAAKKDKANGVAGNLRKALSAEKAKASEDKRRLAARAVAAVAGGAIEKGKFEDLTPIHDDLFNADSSSELTIFDVVHSRYEELRKRWRSR